MTPVKRKVDSASIEAYIDALKKEAWLGPAQGWWPEFLFRVDHISSAASILNDSLLLSRTRAIAAGKMIMDSASPGVIGRTNQLWKDYVRLYFRPRTPTQFHSEGIRRRDEWRDEYGLGACCPIPIVMLFKAREILTLEDTIFSDGNLASSKSDYGNDAKFFRSIPFREVYHDDWLQGETKGRVVLRRHAEVIYPEALELFALNRICCRSSAERDTLLSLLSTEAAARWTRCISLSSKLNLHFRRWTFLDEVELSARKATLRFNPSTLTPGPFRLEIRVKSKDSTERWADESHLAKGRAVIDDLGDFDQYEIEVTLDDELIYKNRYQSLPDLF